MTDPWPALQQVVAALEREGIPYMVVGGIANLAWGAARTTSDVDLTVDIDDVGLDRFLEVAAGLGTPMADDPHDVARRGRLVLLRTPGGTRVDIMLATHPFEREAIAGSTVVSIHGLNVRMCSPEHLLFMKAISSRLQDHLDVIGILRRQRGKLDLARANAAIEGLAADLAEPEIAERWRQAKATAGVE